MWRPDGWVSDQPMDPLDMSCTTGEWTTGRVLTPSEQALFEAGADAMLEALRKRGQPDFLRFLSNCINVQPDTIIGKGKYIFIPGEH